MADGKFQVVSSKKDTYKRYMLVKVGTDAHPATEEAIEEMKKQLEPIINTTKSDFEWVFVTHNVSLEALVFENLK